jgi:hypothetical protein
MSGTILVTRRPCGCVVLLVVNEPDAVKWSSKEILREIRAGRAPVEIVTEEARKLPLHCAEHPLGWDHGKPITPEAETASLWE